MTQKDVINRQCYGRLFAGALNDMAKATQSSLIGQVFDATQMPALVLDPGKQCFHSFTLAQNASFAIPLPPDYDVTRPMYVAVESNLKARVQFDSPTFGNSNVVLLYGTDDETNGTHKAFWTYQGDLSSFTISIPSTADGGATTSIKVFMYEVPDLTDFESFYDKQIGLGYSGET